MAKDPAFLFYSSDFLSGCIDLDMEERGQYITLLCAQHQKGHLSDKTIRLLVGSVSLCVLDKFEKDNEGLYFSPRLDAEIEKRQKFTETRKINGSKGGRPKTKTINKPSGKPLGYPTDNLIENENENENENIIRVEKVKKEPPSLSEFIAYALSNKSNICTETVELKYKSWIENGWKTGHGKEIKNWKSTLLQTLPHIKEKKVTSSNFDINR
jgi:uncharacterized protein YdaU (DUF1376 family)